MRARFASGFVRCPSSVTSKETAGSQPGSAFSIKAAVLAFWLSKGDKINIRLLKPGRFWFRNRTLLQGVVLSTDRAAMAVSSRVVPELPNG
jgi:hypothetical protein